MSIYTPKSSLQYRVMALELTEDTEALRVTRSWLRARRCTACGATAKDEPHSDHASARDDVFRCGECGLVEMHRSSERRKDWALVLLGGTGNGKSQAGTLAWMVTQGALWIRARRIQSMTWDARDELVRRAVSAPLTIVDELLAENEYATAIINEIAEDRGEDFMPTMLLGNGTLEHFFERYNGRMLSRLSVNPGSMCEVGGPDLRAKIEPILVAPSMDWVPAGLGSDPREEFIRTAYLEGLEAALAGLAKRGADASEQRLDPTTIDDMIAELCPALRRAGSENGEKASGENPGADERRRAERDRLDTLALVDYVATTTGREADAILAEIGRTPRTVCGSDRARILALVTGGGL